MLVLLWFIILWNSIYDTCNVHYIIIHSFIPVCFIKSKKMIINAYKIVERQSENQNGGEKSNMWRQTYRFSQYSTHMVGRPVYKRWTPMFWIKKKYKWLPWRYEWWHTFEKIQSILPRLKENCVIVMDSASYHSGKADKIPTPTPERQTYVNGWKKGEVIKKSMVIPRLL